MKKEFSVLLTSIVALLGVLSSSAQSIEYGVRAGINYSELQYDTEESLLLGGESFDFNAGRIGAAFGFFAEIDLPGKWSFQPEVQYSAQGEKTSGILEAADVVTLHGDTAYTEDYFTINTLQLPLLVNYEVVRDVKLSVGPQVALSVWEWEREDDYRFVSLSALAGVTYNFTDNISTSLRASYGITDILDSDTVAQNSNCLLYTSDAADD